VSTLPDVLRAVRDIMVAIDSTTEVLCGERYLLQEGAANRVLFVIGANGSWDGAPKLGAKLIAKITEGCEVYIWGPETTDDFTRYDGANTLRARFLNALHRVAPGRIKPGAVSRMNGTNIVTNGEEHKLFFAYEEHVATIKAIANLPPDNSAYVGGTVVDGVLVGGTLVTGVPTSPPDPLQPAGTPLSTVTADITVEVEEP
jgi:hypothetical protein